MTLLRPGLVASGTRKDEVCGPRLVPAAVPAPTAEPSLRKRTFPDAVHRDSSFPLIPGSFLGVCLPSTVAGLGE